ncbi:uncharacterized protein [Diadema antillarum]|uniref:uncharacterized protein n=1 Tax=Diadema antillarum TaxID=105358 RepID=UPI003A86D4B8
MPDIFASLIFPVVILLWQKFAGISTDALWCSSTPHLFRFQGSYCSRPCDGKTVRLAGGASDNEGRVEIFCDGQWGTVCDGYWDMKEANVVCRQLGYTSALSVFHNAHFGQGSGPIWLDTWTYCRTGREKSLLECYRWPWGCYPSRWTSSCGHSNDVGVRCAGKRNQRAVDAYYERATFNHGFTYGVDRFTYYDMTSELTFTPTSVNDGDILQCHVYGLLRSATLQLEVGQPTPKPTQAPLPNILSIETVELRGKDDVINLVISCHVNYTDQPFPYLHTYTIGTGNTTLSSSSSGSAILSPRPNNCINVTCSATNGVGSTSASLWHCPRAAVIRSISAAAVNVVPPLLPRRLRQQLQQQCSRQQLVQQSTG